MADRRSLYRLPVTAAEVVPMSAADITEDDVRAVVDVLRSGRLSLGPAQERFERLIADYVDVEHAVAVSREPPPSTC